MTIALPIALEVSVLLRIQEMQKYHPDTIEQMIELCREDWIETIANRGDVLQFNGGKKGEAAGLFNKLASAVACMAFVPGGVEIFGRKFEVKKSSTPLDC